MPAPINPIQFASYVLDFANYPPGVFSRTVTFPSVCATGNTIVVAISGAFNAVACWTAGATVSDAQSDGFSLVEWVDGVGTTSGGYGGLFAATNIAGGSVSVTIDITLVQTLFFQPGMDFLVIMAEYPNPAGGTTAVVSGAIDQIFGSAGNSPITLSLTDSHSGSVGVTFSGVSGSGGIGTIAVIACLDLNINGVDYLIGMGRTLLGSANLPVTVPPTYGTFSFEKGNQDSVGNDFLFYWDFGTGPPVVPNWVVKEVTAELVPTSRFIGDLGGHFRYTVRCVDVAQTGSYQDFWNSLGGGGGGIGGGGSGIAVGSGISSNPIGAPPGPPPYPFGRFEQDVVITVGGSVTVVHGLRTLQPNVICYDTSGLSPVLTLPEQVLVFDLNTVTVQFGAAFTGQILVIG